MENTERKEALAAIDIIAAEIHAEYAKVGEQTGHKLPAWENMPEEAKTMSRTLARLMMSKMERVYHEAKEKAKAEAPAPPPAAVVRETVAEKAKALEGIAKLVEDAVARLIDQQADARQGNPITQGVDNAIRAIVEKLAMSVLLSDQELQDHLKENITAAIKEGLFGGGDKDEDEKEET